MTKDEALKMAIEALEADELDMVDDGSGNMVFRKEQALTAIKDALAQPESDYERGFIDGMQKQMQSSVDKAVNAMSQRTWVGLTDEEKHEIRYSHLTSAEFIEFIEAKLKEKNNVCYASIRKNAYIAQMQIGKVKKKSQDELTWVWVAHYEGYKEGYWAVTDNDRFTTDPAKLKEKNNG